MNLDEWNQLCRKAWEYDSDYLQRDRFAKIGEEKYTIRNCNKTTILERTCGTKPFWIKEKLYSIKNREDLETLDELISLKNKV